MVGYKAKTRLAYSVVLSVLMLLCFCGWVPAYAWEGTTATVTTSAGGAWSGVTWAYFTYTGGTGDVSKRTTGGDVAAGTIKDPAEIVNFSPITIVWGYGASRFETNPRVVYMKELPVRY